MMLHDVVLYRFAETTDHLLPGLYLEIDSDRTLAPAT